MATLEKRLGKINEIYFGEIDGRLGFWFDLTGPGWGVSDSRTTWAKWYEGCKWTVMDQRLLLGEYSLEIFQKMEQAKVSRLEDLKGKPVEVTFDGSMLKDWRILTEVL